MPDNRTPKMPASDSSGYRSPWSEAPDSVSGRFSTRQSRGGRTVFVLVILVLVFGAIFLYYWFGKPQGANVSIQFVKPNQILLGDPFTLTVSLANYSDSVLKNAKLSLSLPDGVSFLGGQSGVRVSEQSLGDLGPSSQNQHSFNLIVTGGGESISGGSIKSVKAKLSYTTAANSSAQFENDSNVDLLVGQPAVSLDLTMPQSVFNGEDFEVKVDYANNTGNDFKNLRLKVDYPPIFKFKRSTVQAADEANTSWDLGTVSAGSRGTIVITGNVVGPENSFFNFVGSLAADFLGETYTLNTKSVNLSISQAPLSLTVMLNNGTDYIARPGDELNYVLNYKNNSNETMQNVTVRAGLLGELFDFTTLETDGSFNSLSNTLTWSPAATPALLNVASGASGAVAFKLKLKNNYPIRLLSDKNYTLKIRAEIESPTVPPNTTADKTISLTNFESKVAGNLQLAAEAYWHDATSGILNAGPYPPKVNQPTQYTIHWRLVNFATDVADITVSAYIQSGGRFTGTAKSNINNSSSPSYDAASGLVTWHIDSLAATKGVIGEPAEAIFQVEITPAVNQVNRNIPILSETNMKWTDSFVGQSFGAQAPALDTSLPYDKTIIASDRTVKQ